jgi:hypothetical protein
MDWAGLRLHARRTNGTGFLIPPKVNQYCNYIAQGYFGYTFNKADDPGGGYDPSNYPCPKAAEIGSNSNTNSTGQWFCTHSVTVARREKSDHSRKCRGMDPK